ncbi:uncharacterized protein B0H64DRAFT_409797 [Chaetomium fimeti]|uniref:F-box domain-containing protein n=1 Tax=Chaetomium fimeti TaxID=1854472 RepID=A0AAE0H6X3_9PEZI|nr:hypothetical protein B0H64DRAFT_409797 [Chaetomium fimeti]
MEQTITTTRHPRINMRVTKWLRRISHGKGLLGHTSLSSLPTMAPPIDSHIHLPDEILVHIVQQLDPITLIALSQCSKSWRTLINPNHHDYVQRLLALELTPEYGGIIPLFDEASQTLSPPWESPEWKKTNYACCGCMKLLPHMMFDNHALLRRPYRKPPLGSVEASKASMTDWEPLEPSARWRRIHKKAALLKAERKKWIRFVKRSRSRQLSSEPSPMLWESSHCDVSENIEKYLVGIGRQYRRCIECQRQTGVLSRKLSGYSDLGNQMMPFTAVVSRRVKLTSIIEREFPGLMESLPPDQVPRQRRMMGVSTNVLSFTLYVIHCPSCGKWQESSAFRQPDLFQDGFLHPAKLKGPLLCNHCHLSTHQDPRLLAQELSAHALAIVQHARTVLEEDFKYGWESINREFNSWSHFEPPILGKYKAMNKEILGGLKFQGPLRRKDDIIVDLPSALPDLHRRFKQLRYFLYNEVEPGIRAEVFKDEWMEMWLEDYSLMEAMLPWLNQQIAWVKSNPNAVLNHVLHNNPYQI